MFNILKPFFDRPRPCKELIDVIIYSRCSSNPSFPSNHASNIFTLATLFAGVYRKTASLAFTIAILVCLSRVYLGVHYPADVLFGAFIGGIMGFLGIGLYNKILSRVLFWKYNNESYTTKNSDSKTWFAWRYCSFYSRSLHSSPTFFKCFHSVGCGGKVQRYSL